MNATALAIPPSIPVLSFVSSLEILANAPGGPGDITDLFYAEKFCCRCERFLPEDSFYPCKRVKSGLTAYCRECERERKYGYVPKPETAWRRDYRARCRKYGTVPVVEEFTREDLIARDGERCAECGDASAALELDHVIPVAAGGAHTLSNTRLVDAACNRRKARTEDPALIAAYREEVEGLASHR